MRSRTISRPSKPNFVSSSWSTNKYYGRWIFFIQITSKLYLFSLNFTNFSMLNKSKFSFKAGNNPQKFLTFFPFIFILCSMYILSFHIFLLLDSLITLQLCQLWSQYSLALIMIALSHLFFVYFHYFSFSIVTNRTRRQVTNSCAKKFSCHRYISKEDALYGHPCIVSAMITDQNLPPFGYASVRVRTRACFGFECLICQNEGRERKKKKKTPPPERHANSCAVPFAEERVL